MLKVQKLHLKYADQNKNSLILGQQLSKSNFFFCIFHPSFIISQWGKQQIFPGKYLIYKHPNELNVGQFKELKRQLWLFCNGMK